MWFGIYIVYITLERIFFLNCTELFTINNICFYFFIFIKYLIAVYIKCIQIDLIELHKFFLQFILYESTV